MNLTAYDLVNESVVFGAGNFSVNVSDAPGVALADGSEVVIADATLVIDTDITETNRSLYLYVDVPAALPLGAYVSQSEWVVGASG